MRVRMKDAVDGESAAALGHVNHGQEVSEPGRTGGTILQTWVREDLAAQVFANSDEGRP